MPARLALYLHVFLSARVSNGRAGVTYCRLLSIYEYMISLKVDELRRQARGLESDGGSLLNTPFNENEAIVNTPRQPSVLPTKWMLAMGPFFLMKSAENLQLSEGRQALAASRLLT